MIESITLKSGRNFGGEPTQFKAAPITIVVGPNNSGKSCLLREIGTFCQKGMKSNAHVLDNLSFHGLTTAEVNRALIEMEQPVRPEEDMALGHIRIGKPGTVKNVPHQHIEQCWTKPNDNPSFFCQYYLFFFTLILDGAGRTNLCRQQAAGDLQHPANSLAKLFTDDQLRQKVRAIIYDAFGFYLVIDPSHVGQLRIRFSAVPPASNEQERGLHSAALDFHAGNTAVESTSDGVRVFTGIITEFMAGDPRVLVIDEPETFLHPTLQFKLGKQLAEAASATKKSIVAATHSSHFLMGCIQSGVPLNIVRLTHRNEIATSRLLASQDILKLMRNPLLRSAGVLNGLFYDFVIVTEADTDRAFYQEINERLLMAADSRGIPNVLFLNAQNKQTVRTIVAPLREIGVPAATIVDVDILKEGGSVWANFLRAGNVPEIEISSLATLRADLASRLEEYRKKSGTDMKKSGGIDVLSTDDREAARNLLDRLAKYGLFVVPTGELESWLKHLDVVGKGPRWLISMFERLGENPEAQSYIAPSEGDVWDFLSDIGGWLSDEKRAGIPA